jgi:hypothetical protein
MTKIVRNVALLALLLTTSGSLFNSAHALNVIVGRPTVVYADPSDVVVGLDTAGSCGSNLFHIQRSKDNFRELSAIVLIALSTGKRLTLFVESCSQDRNILSHGAVGE